MNIMGEYDKPWDYAIVVPSLQQLGLSGILQLELSAFLLVGEVSTELALEDCFAV